MLLHSVLLATVTVSIPCGCSTAPSDGDRTERDLGELCESVEQVDPCLESARFLVLSGCSPREVELTIERLTETSAVDPDPQDPCD